jgi:ERCC4-type nuclease
MPTFLLSPSETSRKIKRGGFTKGLLQYLGDDAILSSLPEEKGADILIYSKAGLYGAQRKEIPHDFLSSFGDGRLTRETTLLSQSCKFYEMIGEGRFRYYPNDKVALDMKEPSSYTRKQVEGILFDIVWVKGIPIHYTENIEETARHLRDMAERLNKKEHLALLKRPSIQSDWYVPSSEEIQEWVLQSWVGIGPATAKKIIRHFGQIPLKWTCTYEELCQVSGLSKKKAREMVESLSSIVRKESVKTGATSSFDALRARIRSVRS